MRVCIYICEDDDDDDDVLLRDDRSGAQIQVQQRNFIYKLARGHANRLVYDANYYGKDEAAIVK